MEETEVRESDYYEEQEIYELITIKNFSTYDVGHCDIFRVNFKFFGCPVFGLKIFPNGNLASNEGYISIEVSARPIEPYHLIIKGVISLMDKKGDSRHFQSFSSEGAPRITGIERLIERKAVLESDEFLQDDQLTLCCEMTCILSKKEYSRPPSPSPRAQKIKIHVLPDGEKECYELITQENKTFLLSIYEGEILRHGLCRLSPVFARMFQTEMLERQTKRVVISDINYKTLENLVNYANGGTLVLHCVQEIVDLYKAAAKYEIFDLVKECKRDLLKNVSPENVCNVLALGHLYEDNYLKTAASVYILENFDEVKATSAWKFLEETQPELIEEVHNFDLPGVIEKFKKYCEENAEFYVPNEESAEIETSQIYS